MVLFTMSFLRRKSNVRRETFVPFSKISSLSQTLGGFSGLTHRGQKGATWALKYTYHFKTNMTLNLKAEIGE